MSFDNYESSEELGTPSELYHIDFGSNDYYLTNDIKEWDIDGNTYTPGYGLKRSSIENGKDAYDSPITVSIDAQHPFPVKYIQNVPGIKAVVSIYRFHRNEGNGTPEKVLFWKGKVQAVDFVKQAKIANITIMPLTIGLSKTIPRYTYQGLCNHMLYDSKCGVNKASFSYSGTITSANNNKITVSGLSASKGSGWAEGGYITNSTESDRRLIVSQDGDICTILFPFENSFPLVGETLKIYAGCNHTNNTCNSKFNNLDNFGGWPFIPTKNIFQTGI